MKISSIIAKGRPSVSFEVFPPKRQDFTQVGIIEQQKAIQKTREVVCELAKEKPAFISVTYGAAGGVTSENTISIAEYVQHCGIPALAHLTCIMSSPEQIKNELNLLKEKRIENILCLRGDYPAKDDVLRISHFNHAVDLIKAIRGKHDFCLGGACYPECHPECEHIDTDIAYLKQKVDEGLDFLTTQMFFDNNVFFKYLSRLRMAGITVPVIAGIMPVTNGKQISRICKLSGTMLPPRFRTIVDRFGDYPASMMDAGVAYATEQIIDLFANGVNNIHIYTMNRPETAIRIMRNLGGILGG